MMLKFLSDKAHLYNANWALDIVEEYKVLTFDLANPVLELSNLQLKESVINDLYPEMSRMINLNFDEIFSKHMLLGDYDSEMHLIANKIFKEDIQSMNTVEPNNLSLSPFIFYSIAGCKHNQKRQQTIQRYLRIYNWQD
jgi:hypothetical protein